MMGDEVWNKRFEVAKVWETEDPYPTCSSPIDRGSPNPLKWPTPLSTSENSSLNEGSECSFGNKKSDSATTPFSKENVPPLCLEERGKDTGIKFVIESPQNSDRSDIRNMDTVERIPNISHYRNLDSLFGDMAMVKRPTLRELHNTDTGLDPEVEEVVSEEFGRPAADQEKENMEIRPFIPAEDATKSTSPKFGWIEGVLVRCVLNILGVMLYLRISWVAGQAGILYGSLIVLISAVVTSITTISMCAICTNGEIKGGGAYFLISRSLGPEFGGSIGLIFAFANAVGAAMYVVGFSETVQDLLRRYEVEIVDNGMNDIRIISLVTVLLLCAVVLTGLEFEAKAQVVLLGVLGISLVNFAIGTFIPPNKDRISKGITGYTLSTFEENLHPTWHKESFFSVFSVFFPAATGIMAGANISGDLKDAQKSIPKGTLVAILVTTLIYLAAVWLTGSTVLKNADGSYHNSTSVVEELACVSNYTCPYGLLNYFQVMEGESLWGPLVTIGVFAATLSSAMASLVSAPKVFQAVCKDKLFPGIHYFAAGFKNSEEPHKAYLLALAIAIAMILIGDLNLIAPIISNFFLASYALINYACFDASFAESPGVNWGSSMQAHTYKSALHSMLKLAHTEEHVKNYRPQILSLTGNPVARPSFVDFISNITKENCLMVCGHVLVAKHPERFHGSLQNLTRKIETWLYKRKVKSFYLPVAAYSLEEGCAQLIQLAGLGKLRPNILLMGFKNNWTESRLEQINSYVNLIHLAFDSNLGIGILRVPDGFDFSEEMQSHNHEYADHLQLNLPETLTVGSKLSRAASFFGVQLNKQNANPSCGNISLSTASAVTCASTVIQMDPVKGGGLGRHKISLQPKMSLSRTWRKEASFPVLARAGRRENENPMIMINDMEMAKQKLQASINQFQMGQKIKGTIDVWWLYDDGGLSLLLPHLLTNKGSYLEGSRLRVFTIASSKRQIEQEQMGMAGLLSRFRIDFSDVFILPDVTKTPKHSSLKEFNRLIAKFRVGSSVFSPTDIPDNVDLISDSEILAHKDRTYRHLRVRELLLQHSKDANLVVLTLPVPRKGVLSPFLFMAWLELLTKDMPPMLLLRGNQQSVLTFYS